MKKAGSIGDVIFFKSEYYFNAEIVSDFVDDVEGEDANKFFEKKFRYSTNGVDFSEWQDLTTANLLALTLNKNELFFAEFSYRRVGSDDSGILTASFVALNVSFFAFDPRSYYNNSFFNQVVKYHDSRAVSWSANVLRKTVGGSILPRYINRKGKDSLSLWRSIADMFSWVVNYARQISYVEGNRFLLRKFLESRNYFFSKDDDLTQLNIVRENLYVRMSQRGTYEYRHVELQNLLDNNFAREFIFELSERHKIGWNVNNSSPLYLGLEDHRPFVKGYEPSADVLNLNAYPLINENNVSLEENDGKQTMLISGVPANETAGIGCDSVFIQEIAIPVSTSKSYIFSTSIRAQLGVKFTMGVHCFDQNEILLNTLEANTEAQKQNWFEKQEVLKDDVYYRFHGHLYSPEKTFPNEYGNSAIPIDGISGSHLRLPENTAYAIPYLILDNSDEATVSGSLWLHNIDFKMMDMQRSLAFLGASNYIQAFLVNGSGKYTDRELETLIDEYLKPYNSHVIYDWLEFQLGSDVIPPPPTPTGSVITLEENE